MKEKILAALNKEITDVADDPDGPDVWYMGYMRGLRRAKVIVNSLMEREEHERSVPREASIRELDNIELDKLPDGEFRGFSSYVDNQKRETIVPFWDIDPAKNTAVRYRGALAVIKLEGEVTGYAAVIPFESPKAGEG
jgi:hypothetical protein